MDINSEALSQSRPLDELPGYGSILLAVDSSDHSNRCIKEAVALAALWDSRLTATHAYAASMHDLRFRQMEGGLPERFRAEQELERQREVHDDLIARGLNIVTDSYLDQVERESRDHAIPLQRRPLEGKNYRALVRETNAGGYDLLVLGALGLGAVRGSRLGSVCRRVVRRSETDTLVVKDPHRSIAEGPILVAVDGSRKAYGGLLAALALARRWGVTVEAISAFDPYYHYVAFNRIAGVLSAEAGKVFRFQEQEQLHEDIIDSGLAKIYQGHLDVSVEIAAEYGVPVSTRLLDGKPHDVIAQYVARARPSLLVLGKTGIHADPELDIGGNAETLLEDVDCAVLLSQREYEPPVERLAAATTSWTHEAEARMSRVPTFVRNMARMAILRYAQERGHTVITESIVDAATAQLMPGHATQAMQQIVDAHAQGELARPATNRVLRWSAEASRRLQAIDDLSLRGNLSLRAEKKARVEASPRVEIQHLEAFLDPIRPPEPSTTAKAEPPAAASKTPAASAAAREAEGADTHRSPMHWQAAALARLMRVPGGFMRDASRERIEDYARRQGHPEITLEVAEQGLAGARQAMAKPMRDDAAESEPQAAPGRCPFGGSDAARAADLETRALVWSGQGKDLLQSIPVGFCRDMTVRAAEAIAAQRGVEEVDAAFVEQVLDTIEAGSAAAHETLPWDDAARRRLQRVPESVRGMLIREIEGAARRQGLPRVDEGAVDAVKRLWRERGVFHLDPDDPRHG